MKQFQYKVRDPQGMHARPAGILSAEAKKFTSKLTVKAGGESADLKKILSVMGLAVKCGDTLTINVEGDDEIAAAKVMEDVFKKNF